MISIAHKRHGRQYISLLSARAKDRDHRNQDENRPGKCRYRHRHAIRIVIHSVSARSYGTFDGRFLHRFFRDTCRCALCGFFACSHATIVAHAPSHGNPLMLYTDMIHRLEHECAQQFAQRRPSICWQPPSPMLHAHLHGRSATRQCCSAKQPISRRHSHALPKHTPRAMITRRFIMMVVIIRTIRSVRRCVPSAHVTSHKTNARNGRKPQIYPRG